MTCSKCSGPTTRKALFSSFYDHCNKCDGGALKYDGDFEIKVKSEFSDDSLMDAIRNTIYNSTIIATTPIGNASNKRPNNKFQLGDQVVYMGSKYFDTVVAFWYDNQLAIWVYDLQNSFTKATYQNVREDALTVYLSGITTTNGNGTLSNGQPVVNNNPNTNANNGTPAVQVAQAKFKVGDMVQMKKYQGPSGAVYIIIQVGYDVARKEYFYDLTNGYPHGNPPPYESELVAYP